MAKIQIKSEKLTPLGVFFYYRVIYALLAQTIDFILGLRCTSYSYQYNEILHSLMCIYLFGGSCIEDVTRHLMNHSSICSIEDSKIFSNLGTILPNYCYIILNCSHNTYFLTSYFPSKYITIFHTPTSFESSDKNKGD